MTYNDKQGNVLRAGDWIMYIVGTDHDICYGRIKEFTRVTRPYGRVCTRLKVWKTHGRWHEEDKFVYLTSPTVFLCDCILRFPTDTKIEGT